MLSVKILILYLTTVIVLFELTTSVTILKSCSRFCNLSPWSPWNCTGCLAGTSDAFRQRGICCMNDNPRVCLKGCHKVKTDVEQHSSCAIHCVTSTTTLSTSTMSTSTTTSASTVLTTASTTSVPITTSTSTVVTTAVSTPVTGIPPTSGIPTTNSTSVLTSPSTTTSSSTSTTSLTIPTNSTMKASPSTSSASINAKVRENSVCLTHCKASPDWKQCMKDCLYPVKSTSICKIIWVIFFILGLVIGAILMAIILTCVKRREEKKTEVTPDYRRPAEDDGKNTNGKDTKETKSHEMPFFITDKTTRPYGNTGSEENGLMTPSSHRTEISHTGATGSTIGPNGFDKIEDHEGIDMIPSISRGEILDDDTDRKGPKGELGTKGKNDRVSDFNMTPTLYRAVSLDLDASERSNNNVSGTNSKYDMNNVLHIEPNSHRSVTATGDAFGINGKNDPSMIKDHHDRQNGLIKTPILDQTANVYDDLSTIPNTRTTRATRQNDNNTGLRTTTTLYRASNTDADDSQRTNNVTTKPTSPNDNNTGLGVTQYQATNTDGGASKRGCSGNTQTNGEYAKQTGVSVTPTLYQDPYTYSIARKGTNAKESLTSIPKNTAQNMTTTSSRPKGLAKSVSMSNIGAHVSIGQGDRFSKIQTPTLSRIHDDVQRQFRYSRAYDQNRPQHLDYEPGRSNLGGSMFNSQRDTYLRVAVPTSYYTSHGPDHGAGGNANQYPDVDKTPGSFRGGEKTIGVAKPLFDSPDSIRQTQTYKDDALWTPTSYGSHLYGKQPDISGNMPYGQTIASSNMRPNLYEAPELNHNLIKSFSSPSIANGRQPVPSTWYRDRIYENDHREPNYETNMINDQQERPFDINMTQYQFKANRSDNSATKPSPEAIRTHRLLENQPRLTSSSNRDEMHGPILQQPMDSDDGIGGRRVKSSGTTLAPAVHRFGQLNADVTHTITNGPNGQAKGYSLTQYLPERQDAHKQLEVRADKGERGEYPELTMTPRVFRADHPDDEKLIIPAGTTRTVAQRKDDHRNIRQENSELKMTPTVFRADDSVDGKMKTRNGITWTDSPRENKHKQIKTTFQRPEIDGNVPKQPDHNANHHGEVIKEIKMTPTWLRADPSDINTSKSRLDMTSAGGPNTPTKSKLDSQNSTPAKELPIKQRRDVFSDHQKHSEMNPGINHDRNGRMRKTSTVPNLPSRTESIDEENSRPASKLPKAASVSKIKLYPPKPGSLRSRATAGFLNGSDNSDQSQKAEFWIGGHSNRANETENESPESRASVVTGRDGLLTEW